MQALQLSAAQQHLYLLRAAGVLTTILSQITVQMITMTRANQNLLRELARAPRSEIECQKNRATGQCAHTQCPNIEESQSDENCVNPADLLA